MQSSRSRIWLVLLLLTLAAPLVAPASGVHAQGYIVRTWQSPTYGFSLDYRTDAFWQTAEETANGVDVLVLESEVGQFSVEAMPVALTPDECVQVVIDEVAASDGNHEVPLFVENGSGLIRSTYVDQAGYYTDFTRRIDCITADDGSYMVRFQHFARTSDFGMWETAARDIRASYRPGIPANNPLPSNITEPDGELEVAVMPLWQAITPPGEFAGLYQPRILLTVEFIFASVSEMDSLLETDRIIIANVGPSVSHVWISGDTLFHDDTLTIPPGAAVVGHLTFAIPATMTTVTFCYQHVTDANCTALGEYELGGVYGGGPNSRPRINPGR